MGFFDGVWGAIKNAGATVYKTAGQGLDWLNKNVTTPVRGFAEKVPVVGDVVKKAAPIFDLYSKGTANMARGDNIAKGIGLGDVARAGLAIPGTIGAAKNAINKVTNGDFS